jgi:hypothetical protein
VQGAAPAPAPAGPTAPLPGWVGSAVQVTTQLGFPAVVAGVLLWFVLTRVGDSLGQIQQQEEARTRMVAAMQQTLIDALDRQTAAFVKAIEENKQVNRELGARLERHLGGRQ